MYADKNMPFYSWNDLLVGTSFPEQMARSARTFACSMWQKYPQHWVPDNIISSPIKFFWNSVCSADNIRRDPKPDFKGGQCPVLYRIDFYIRYKSGIDELYSAGNYQGPIREILIAPTPSNGDGLYVIHGINTPYTRSLARSNVESNPVVYFEIRRLYRLDGQIDSCGDPNYYWEPPLFPPPLPGNETWNFNFNDGGKINLNVPFVWNNIKFEIPLAFNFSVGEIIIDVGGVSINFNENNNWKMDDRDTDFNDFRKDFDDFRKDFDDNKKNLDDFKKDYDDDKKPKDPDSNDKEIDEDKEDVEKKDKYIDFVIIKMTKEPEKDKTILLNNPEDNIYLMGYFSWLIGSARAEQIRVRKRVNVFVKPDWADGFRFYTVNRARATVETYKKKIDVPE